MKRRRRESTKRLNRRGSSKRQRLKLRESGKQRRPIDRDWRQKLQLKLRD
jgi:hypothetical protein